MGFVSAPVAFDACVLINLLASGQAGEMVLAIGSPGYICTGVHNEVFNIESTGRRTPFSGSPISPLIEEGVLGVANLSSEHENNLYVQHSVRFGDGESMTMAIAQSRGWAVATDDRKARNAMAAAQLSPTFIVLTTPEILRNWVDVASPAVEDVGLAIRRIETIGRFRPSTRDPLRVWWDTMCATVP